MRNALAHFEYYRKNDLYFFKNSMNKEREIKLPPFTQTISFIDNMEIIFNPDYKINQIRIGMVKILYLLFFEKKKLKAISNYLNAYKVLNNEKLYPEIQIICLIISSFFHIKSKNLNEAVNLINTAKEIMQNLPDQGKINVWGWIASRSLFYIGEYWESSYENLFEHFSILPKNTEARKWIFGLKGTIYSRFENKRFTKKANSLLKLSQKT